MTTPRRLLVDPDNACDYHLVSRCVRRSWLCGRDRRTGRDYSHRKAWLAERIAQLSRCFAVQIWAYAVMSSHFHLVARYDPQACRRWSGEEAARRWTEAFPPKPRRGQSAEEAKAEAAELLLGDPDRLERARATLGSLSMFMKHLKQPIARRANREDGCKGHFFEQRFYSGALLSGKALLAAMAYVDLNEVRAGIAARIEDCRHSSIAVRVRENDAAAVDGYLAPVLSGLPDGAAGLPGPSVRPGDYAAMVRSAAAAVAAPKGAPAAGAGGESGWLARISALRRRQRAYGSRELLAEWAERRRFQLREMPLPD